MKKSYLIPLGLLFALSCKTEEPTLVDCSPTKVVITTASPSDYIFSDSNLISVDENKGTDQNVQYAYAYTNDKVSQITSTDSDGAVLVYTATYNGDNLEKLTSYQDGSTTIPTIEIRQVYSGGVLGSVESWYANANGTLFQIAHSNFGYDGSSNLVQSEIYIDFNAFFSLAFGTDPTGYAPTLLLTTTYVPSNSANPLYGTVSVSQPDFSIMKNLPASMSTTDLDGNVTSESFEFESDENGNTTKATGSGNTTLTATFECN